MSTIFVSGQQIMECYDEIKKEVLLRCKKSGACFNEDVFHDSMISINNVFNKYSKTFTWEELIRYFSAAFKKNCLRKKSYSYVATRERKKEMDAFEVYDEGPYDEDRDKQTYELYNKIVDDIKEKYGEEALYFFKEHIMGNIQYKKMTQKYGKTEEEFHALCKKIRNYVKNKYKNVEELWK